MVKAIAYSEGYVTHWFESNFEKLGFEKILKKQHNKTPDYIMLKDGREVKVEAEFLSSDFIRHKHRVEDVDVVVCAKKDVTLPVKVIELSDYMIAHRHLTGDEVIDKWIRDHPSQFDLKKAIEKTFGNW